MFIITITTLNNQDERQELNGSISEIFLQTLKSEAPFYNELDAKAITLNKIFKSFTNMDINDAEVEAYATPWTELLNKHKIVWFDKFSKIAKYSLLDEEKLYHILIAMMQVKYKSFAIAVTTPDGKNVSMEPLKKIQNIIEEIKGMSQSNDLAYPEKIMHLCNNASDEIKNIETLVLKILMR